MPMSRAYLLVQRMTFEARSPKIAKVWQVESLEDVIATARCSCKPKDFIALKLLIRDCSDAYPSVSDCIGNPTPETLNHRRVACRLHAQQPSLTCSNSASKSSQNPCGLRRV